MRHFKYQFFFYLAKMFTSYIWLKCIQFTTILHLGVSFCSFGICILSSPYIHRFQGLTACVYILRIIHYSIINYLLRKTKDKSCNKRYVPAYWSCFRKTRGEGLLNPTVSSIALQFSLNGYHKMYVDSHESYEKIY